MIKDCTEALQYNNKYVKALHRRAKVTIIVQIIIPFHHYPSMSSFQAFEVTKQLEPCLEDITAVCILEAFQNPSSLQMADRVLKDLGFYS